MDILETVKRIVDNVVNTMELAIVETYDDKTQTADILIPYSKTKIPSIRVCQLGGELGVCNIPLKKGDSVICLFSKSGIQNYIDNQNNNENDFDLLGFDNLSNCVAIPLTIVLNNFTRLGFKSTKGELSIDPTNSKLNIIGNGVNVIKKAVAIVEKDIEIHTLLNSGLQVVSASIPLGILDPSIASGLTPLIAQITSKITELTALKVELNSSAS